MERYDLLERIGEGTFGEVYRGRDKASGRIVALKRVRLRTAECALAVCVLRVFRATRAFSLPHHNGRALQPFQTVLCVRCVR